MLERAAEHHLLARLGEPVVQILAGAETAAGAGDQQGAAIGIRLDVIERGLQRNMHILRERVEPRRTIERDDAKTVAFLDENGGLVHGSSRSALLRSLIFTALRQPWDLTDRPVG